MTQVLRLTDLIADGKLRGQRVFIRADLNVPQDDAGNITEDTRIRASVPAIRQALDAGAAVMVTSHLGRPTEGQLNPQDSLAPVAKRLGELLGSDVPLVAGWVDNGVTVAPGDVVLLENCRGNKGEKKNSDELAQKMAALCDIYVNDAFGTAHSSTSISAALGMAVASQLKGEQGRAIAVIGDGAMTAGEAFEALNNAGVCEDIPLIVILNDNDMSISPPVGALNRYLAKLMSGRFYASAKEGMRKMLPPPMRELAHKLEEHAKGMVMPATLFEEFGFNYIGPIDGHDLDLLIPTLQNIRGLRGPQFLHVVTKKGQGYKLAEADPVLYHGPGKFNPHEGIKAGGAAKKTYTKVFGEWLCDAAELDPRVVGITPAMREGSGLVEFERRFPQRYFDVGIAEQHAVTFAGGLAAEGLMSV
ncbi:hypothetical protein DFQ30_005589 [Apophysomyces sp. BC1015]|nr:hypothetical protein DFQ30_005589 [Apophysomyces sp. BC1015]